MNNNNLCIICDKIDKKYRIGIYTLGYVLHEGYSVISPLNDPFYMNDGEAIYNSFTSVKEAQKVIDRCYKEREKQCSKLTYSSEV